MLTDIIITRSFSSWGSCFYEKPTSEIIEKSMEDLKSIELSESRVVI